MTKATNAKLIWAIDPFNEDENLLASAIETARNWREQHAGEVVPVYLLGPRQIGFAYELEFDSVGYIAKNAQDRANHLMRGHEFKGLKPLQVLCTQSGLLLHDIQALVDHSMRLKADAILISTRGRSGMRRAVLGSFAEAVLLHSPLPVLTVSPLSRKASTLKQILFPTEFGEYSKLVFKKVARLAQERAASISLLHIIPKVYGFVPVGDLLGYPSLYSYDLSEAINSERVAAAKEFESWIQLSSKLGVPIEFEVVEATNGIAETILKVARDRDADLIALESESGRIKAALLGSVCRRVVRDATCPVWSLRGALAFGKSQRRSAPSYSVIEAEAERIRNSA